jgi:hypothetical protein
MHNDTVFGFWMGVLVSVFFWLVGTTLSASSSLGGCRNTTQQECVYVGYLSESQVEMLKQKTKEKKEHE